MSWSAVRRRHSGRPVAVVLHGVGSTGEFARRCLAAPLGSLGYDVVAPDLRGHASAGSCRDPAAHSVGSHLVDLQALAEQVDVRLVAGISLGAELALRWSAEHPRLDGVVLCLPGLTGPTTVAAAANRHVADRVAREGVEPVLAELARDPAALPWVAGEVARSWRRHDPASLVAALRAAADAEPLPDGELSRIAVPAGIAAVVDDLAHPLATAEHLAQTLPRAALRTLSLVDLAADRSRLGRAAVAALAVARERAVPPTESR